MARRDIKVTHNGAHVEVSNAFDVMNLTEEEAGELAQQLLSKLGCSFEIKWPDLEPTMDERIKAGQAALTRRRELAEEYVSELEKVTGSLGERDRGFLVQAYIAGHDASPKPLNHPYR